MTCPTFDAADRSAPAAPVVTQQDGCPTCGGQGWLIDHSEECYDAGDCVGCGGVQVQCWDPRGHADPCTHCDGLGQVWNPTRQGNVDGCSHCVGGWVWRSGGGKQHG